MANDESCNLLKNISQPKIKVKNLDLEFVSVARRSNEDNTTVYSRPQRRAKTASERSREFRARKRVRRQEKSEKPENANVNEELSSQDDQHVGTSSANKCRLSSVERTRRWRQKRRHQNGTPKKMAKTGAQRMREYRQRKKRRRNDSSNDDDSEHNSASLSFSEEEESDDECDEMDVPEDLSDLGKFYEDYEKHKKAHEKFFKKFTNNSYGHPCDVCGRLWFKSDLKLPSRDCDDILKKILLNFNVAVGAKICLTCKIALDNKKIPKLSTYNGFKYPDVPIHLKKLDFVSERLISARIPFVQIRRLRYVQGQFELYGQVINAPITTSTMVNRLPRNIYDDFCIYVNVNKKMIYKSNYLEGSINKEIINAWLEYLITTPLYTVHNITIDGTFFNEDVKMEKSPWADLDEYAEEITLEDRLIAQQHTLLWNDDKFLSVASSFSLSRLFDGHAEELSFPTIYLGQVRAFRDDIKVTPFMIVSSELRREDRRGVTPYHLLYVALKVMRLRINECLNITSKHTESYSSMKYEQIESREYIKNSLESNLIFLRSIPNSTWYWSQRKEDLFAIIRQKGRPTVFMTLNANEEGWLDLLELLYKLASKGQVVTEPDVSKLSFMQKSTLINEDPVTCAIYFNKIINVIMDIIQSKECNPFGRYRVAHYFKRIDFQHRGTTRAHILLWLYNAPADVFCENYIDAITMIDQLVSVDPSQASGQISLQTHQHSQSCYKKIPVQRSQKCSAGAPFLPCSSTMVLTPMQKTDPQYREYHQRYIDLRINLENADYKDLDDFYKKNNIAHSHEYHNILRAGITRPKIFYKRQPNEKYINAFNPFILNVLKSTMDFQIITDEYSCAKYIAEYVNKTDRGISDLQYKISQVMNEYPKFNIIQMTQQMGVEMLNSVEISSQEAAWYLLREPMSKCSLVVNYINTVWPTERQKIRKTHYDLSKIDEDSDGVWKDDYFQKYQQRPKSLDDITLAYFVSKYYKTKHGDYIERKEPQVIRYRQYDVINDFNEYRREMVTLHIPFRDENTDILENMKFINIYDDNEDLILQRSREFESDLDINQTIEICRQLCRKGSELDSDDDYNDDVDDDSKMDDVDIEDENKFFNDPDEDMLDIKEPVETIDQCNATTALSVVWTDDNSDVYRLCLNYVAKFMRDGVRTAGIAIYNNSSDECNVKTSKITLSLRNVSDVDVGQSLVGDMCVADGITSDGREMIMAVVYITPNSSIEDIIKFIHRRLLIYSHVGSQELGENFHTLPLILGGEFNINFAADSNAPLIQFLKDKFNLSINHDPKQVTVKYNTTIDTVFSRYLDKLISKMY